MRRTKVTWLGLHSQFGSREARSYKEKVIELELKVPPIVVFAVVGAAMWLVSATLQFASVAIAGRWVLAVLLAVTAVLLTGFAFREFQRAATTIEPLKPNLASSLVVTGIYRYTRNPMYLGLSLLLLGWGLLLENVLSVALVLVFLGYITRFQIVPEERALRAAFGEAYERYRTSTRRWI